MKNTSPAVDAYIAESADFAQPILKKTRRLFQQASPDIEETIKWRAPFFEYQGIVGYMVAFKKHVGFGFWKAELMSDPEKLFANEGNKEPTRLKVSCLDDPPANKILEAYIKEAVEHNRKGVKIARSKAKRRDRELEIPDYFINAIRKNIQALATFEGFSHTNRREYVEWVAEAKRETTRERRLSTAVEWMAAGKPRNWKYMKGGS